MDVIYKNGLTLAIFAIISTGLIAVINMVTKPIIRQQSIIYQKQLLDQIIPPEMYNNIIQNECYIINYNALNNNDKSYHLYVARKDDLPVAAILETTASDGYAGAIQMLVGADFYGKVLGVRVVKHQETPGIGDKIELRISNWIRNFSGVQLHGVDDSHFAIKKDNGDFDQFTGATITPRAVVNATKRATLFIETLLSKLSLLPHCEYANE